MMWMPQQHGGSQRTGHLHIMDQGVTQYFLGSLLSSIVRLPRYGRNMEARNLFLWNDLIEWYHVNDIKSDKIKKLKLNRYDHKPPVFKGSAAQVRKLVPWAEPHVAWGGAGSRSQREESIPLCKEEGCCSVLQAEQNVGRVPFEVVEAPRGENSHCEGAVCQT